MKKRLKSVVCAALAAVLMVCALCVGASAQKVTVKDAWLSFEVWRGQGETSVSIPNDWIKLDVLPTTINASEFEKLTIDDKDVGEDSFRVSQSGDDTVITLNESYLKSFTTDGCYYFEAEFKNAVIPLHLYVVTRQIKIEDRVYSFGEYTGTGNASVSLKNYSDIAVFYPDLFESLTFNGEEVAADDYSLNSFAGSISIILHEDYLKNFEPGTYYFEANFANVAGVDLKLTVSKPYAFFDINGDGKITLADARLALRAAARLESLSKEQFCAADVNDDGKISGAEIRATIRVAARLVDEIDAAQEICGFYFDHIGVALKHEYSECPSREYAPEFFSEKYIKSAINDMEYTLEDKDKFSENYHQIIWLYLKEPSRDNVKKAIEDVKSKNLKEVEAVDYASFYYFTTD